MSADALLLEAPGRNLFHASLLASGGCWAIPSIPGIAAASLWALLLSYSFLPFVSLCVHPFLIRPPVNRFKVRLNPRWPHISQLYLQRPYFQIRSHIQVLKLRIWTHRIQEHNLTHYLVWSRRAFREGNCYPLQYCWLENSIDIGAWWATVHGVAKSQTRLTLSFLHGRWGCTKTGEWVTSIISAQWDST